MIVEAQRAAPPTQAIG